MAAGASIMNTASVVAYNPPQILVDYATTKAGIVAFSKPWPSSRSRRASG